MNEEAFGRRVAVHLSAGARNIDGDVSERLRAARMRALAAHRADHRLGTRLAAAFRRFFPPLVRPAALAMLLLVAVFAGDYWTTWLRVGEMEEVDTALLIDDLPIDAYLDSDFKAWVQDDSRS